MRNYFQRCVLFPRPGEKNLTRILHSVATLYVNKVLFMSKHSRQPETLVANELQRRKFTLRNCKFRFTAVRLYITLILHVDINVS